MTVENLEHFAQEHHPNSCLEMLDQLSYIVINERLPLLGFLGARLKMDRLRSFSHVK